MRNFTQSFLATCSPSLIGTALYVYCVIANNVSEGTGTLANYEFTLDGQAAGNYHHDPENVTDYFYNVPGAFLRLASAFCVLPSIARLTGLDAQSTRSQDWRATRMS